jgi:hypothetical protein
MRALLAIALVTVSFTASAAQSSDERVSKIAYDIRKGVTKVTKQFSAAGYPDGLAGFIRANDLVVTYTEGSCSVAKKGICQIDTYVTRASYKKHRSGDPGAFCGALLRWEASEKNLKKWTPASALAEQVAVGKEQLALQPIDDKNSSFCNR